MQGNLRVSHPLPPHTHFSSLFRGGSAPDQWLDLAEEWGCWLGRHWLEEKPQPFLCVHFLLSFSLSSPQTFLPPPESGVCVRALPLPWHQCDMALNGLCHVKQAPLVNYLAKVLAFPKQFIPTSPGTAPAYVSVWGCVRERTCEGTSSPLLL